MIILKLIVIMLFPILLISFYLIWINLIKYSRKLFLKYKKKVNNTNLNNESIIINQPKIVLEMEEYSNSFNSNEKFSLSNENQKSWRHYKSYLKKVKSKRMLLFTSIFTFYFT